MITQVLCAKPASTSRKTFLQAIHTSRFRAKLRISTSVKLEAAPTDVGDDSVHSAAVRARTVARTCDQTATFGIENKP